MNEFPNYNTNYAKEKINLRDLKKDRIDYGVVKTLASFGLKPQQISLAIKIKYDKFKELLKIDEELKNAISEGQTDLHLSILAGQLQMALPDPENGYIGNASMLKRLGEVHLGQSEKLDMNIKEDLNIVLKWSGKKNEEVKEEDKD